MKDLPEAKGSMQQTGNTRFILREAEPETVKRSETPGSEIAEEPAIRGEGWLRGLDTGWQALDRFLHQAIPPALNPLGQLGAMANTCLLIAVVSGIALLWWYTPSVHQAHASLENIRAGSWLGQLVRSVHRYSSDGCLLLILLHAFRIVCQRRFTGARWLAWTTGVLLLALIWFIGWTGYSLVWDVRAQHTALGTARFADRLPIFAEPLSRSFLTDDGVPSLLFFLTFFVHMLTPLALGIGVWMHLMRINRARFLAGRTMTLWVMGSLLVLSALFPAISANPAQMTMKTKAFTMDWWYLWPLALTDRLGGGALWGLFLFGGILVITVPWWMSKRRRLVAHKAQVDLPRCIGCTLCAQDCPFNAITMIPREDGRKFAVQSSVDPSLCVGCGICTGACDSQAINLPALHSREVEKRLHAWLGAEKARGRRPFVAFCCGESAGALLRPDSNGTAAELPGYRIERVPCVGWVSAMMLERALQNGAAGVLVVGCGEGDAPAREGMKWFEQRLEGTREPKVDPSKAHPSRVRYVKLGRMARADLMRVAREFQEGEATQGCSPRGKNMTKAAAGVGLAVVLAAAVLVLSDLPYRTPHSPEPELVVSFSHAGSVLQPKQLSKEELAKRLPHMRSQVNVTRERVPVRLRIFVDEQKVFERAYQPKGLSKDGPSVAIARLPMAPGWHQLKIEIGDTANTDQWEHRWSEAVQFEPERVRVVMFDTKGGFSMH